MKEVLHSIEEGVKRRLGFCVDKICSLKGRDEGNEMLLVRYSGVSVVDKNWMERKGK